MNWAIAADLNASKLARCGWASRTSRGKAPVALAASPDHNENARRYAGRCHVNGLGSDRSRS